MVPSVRTVGVSIDNKDMDRTPQIHYMLVLRSNIDKKLRRFVYIFECDNNCFQND